MYLENNDDNSQPIKRTEQVLQRDELSTKLFFYYQGLERISDNWDIFILFYWEITGYTQNTLITKKLYLDRLSLSLSIIWEIH